MVAQEISHYRIIRKLGAGGMGEVFLAEDLRLERKVAIKMLPARLTGDQQAKKRLLREARAAATLDHPNICAIHEVSEEGDCTFIVMQYIEGRSLAAMVKNNPLSTTEVIDIGVKVAEALADAHSHGIIHRDIKPHNVIVTPKGKIKVLDFGLAKLMHSDATNTVAQTESRLTEAGQVVGTVGYMSPEQLRGRDLDARSDLFSLGALLYECATGKPAFAGPSTIDISLQVLQIDPPKPSDCIPGLPPELDYIIAKATAKDVQARYQSASDLIKDLEKLREKIVGDSRGRTQPLSRAPEFSRMSMTAALSGVVTKNPFKVGLIAVPLAILAIWLAIPAFHSSPHQPSPDARIWYDKGLEAMREGTYYQASKRFEQSIEKDDRFALAHARLADTFIEIDALDKAMEELLRALSLVPDRSALASNDAIYLDAVAATVRRESAEAIGHYTKLLDRAPEAEKAAAYVDLGRSYEKDEKIEKAEECYLEATKRDAQSPAAFLRLGIIYGRRQNSKNADEAFKEAEKIYQGMDNQEGLAEVSYQRGALLVNSKKLPEAEAALKKVFGILEKAQYKYQLIKTHLQLSLVYRDEGNTELAKESAAEAIRLAQAENIRSLATNGLIELGYAYYNRGEWEEAGKYFRQALDLARRDRAPRSEARAMLALGRMNYRQGNADEAISMLEEALKFYQPAGYRKESSIALLTLGRSYSFKGNFDVAYKIFDQQLELAKELDDPAQLSATYESIAFTRGVRQEMYPEALADLEKAYKIDEARGAKGRMAFELMNRGTFLWPLGQPQEARAALDQAFSIATRPEVGARDVIAWVHLTSAQWAVGDRRLDEARKKARLALEMSATQYKDVDVQANYTLGLAEAFSGQPQAGIKFCEQALDLAIRTKPPHLISSSLLALAEVLLEARDGQRALENALKAQAMFTLSGQMDSEWRALLIAARASELTGNKSAALDYATKADTLCAGLQQRWGNESYERYLRRPDIQNYRKQLAQIRIRTK